MRKKVMVLLAAASSIAINAAGQAGVKSNDLWRFENTLPVAIKIDAPRMINWNICLAPRSDSASSIHSRRDVAMQLFPGAALPEDLCIVCYDPAEEARKRNSIAGTRSADPKEVDASWSACDADGFDDPGGLTGQHRA